MFCPKCERTVPSFHSRSHVLPDWMFKESYSDTHKIIHVDINALRARKEQSATYGEFWCEDCETGSGIYDRYASLILTNRSMESPQYKQISRKLLSHADESKPGLELWTGLDFKQFQNFVLVCVLRAELFARTKNQHILNTMHFEKIRSLYDSEIIDDQLYPILVSRSPEGDERRHWSFLPYRTRIYNHNGILFRASGFQFQMLVSSHEKPDIAMLGRLNRHGELPLVIDNFENTGPYKSSLPRLNTVVKEYPFEKLRLRRPSKKS